MCVRMLLSDVDTCVCVQRESEGLCERVRVRMRVDTLSVLLLTEVDTCVCVCERKREQEIVCVFVCETVFV